MDCEKFEATLIDELYGELDEVTSAASKRHAAGCARCSALLGGLRATRRVAALPIEAPSAGFEERILAAARDAEQAIQPKLSFAEIISLAGRWAMRPQTAMAAVLLLMVGTSGVFLSRKSKSSGAVAVVVTETGTPQAAFADMPAASAAPPAAPAPLAALAPAAAGPAPAPTAFGHASASNASSFSAGGLGSLGAVSGGGGGAIAKDEALKEDGYARRMAKPPPPPVARAAAEPFAQAPTDDIAPLHAAPSKAPEPAAQQSSPLDAAVAQYRAHDYDGAVRSFDALAAAGDNSAAVWAARSVRDGSGGCSAAIARYDQIAASAWGSKAGYDATIEGGECYRALGQTDKARLRFAQLLTVPAYAMRAQADIDGISRVPVAAKARAVSKAAPSTPPAAAPPAAAPAASAVSPTSY